jgi:signal transduction histidine kinase
MRSLWLRLMLAFGLVITIGLAANALLLSRSASGQFSRYVTASGQAWAESLAPSLGSYYARNGSWEGAQAVLDNPWTGPLSAASGQTAGGHMGGMMGRGTNGTSSSMGPGMMSGDAWASMGIRLLLADASGRVVADTAGAATGDPLAAADLASGTPVVLNDHTVGTVLAVSTLSVAASPANDFLGALQRSSWLSGLAAGVLALGLGLVLFRHIVAPVRAVTSAAERIAAGELGQRVPVRSGDEIGQLAHSFNQMADALARDRRLRQNMVADIAHELRTPLSVIQANLEAMLDGVLPASAEEIASLHEETALLSRLVADLRLLSLAEAGQLNLERSRVDPATLLTSATERLRFQAEAGGVTLATDIPPQLPAVEVDADRMRQVLINLIGNALRYTPPGGRVAVRAAHAGRGELQFQVSDTGQGIRPADRPHLFDRFYRAEKSRSRAGGGSGIGLTIAKHLVEAHGGRIWATSPGEGQGSTFTFVLPVGEEK